MSKISYPQNLKLWKFIYAHPDNLCRTCQLLLWIKNFVENLSTLPVYYRIYSAAVPFWGVQGLIRKENGSGVNFLVFLCKS